MASTSSRLVGSGYTILYFGGPQASIPISFVRMINENPPKLVAEPRPIHPIDFEHPAEIMTAKAIGEGTVEVDMIETWSEQAWNRLAPALGGLGGQARGSGNACDTILDIVRVVDNAQGEIYLAKLIATPQTTTESVARNIRSVLYMGAKIVDVADGDQNLSTDTMDQAIRVTFMYTHRLFQYSPVGGRGYTDFKPPFPTLNNRRSTLAGPNLNTRI